MTEHFPNNISENEEMVKSCDSSSHDTYLYSLLSLLLMASGFLLVDTDRTSININSFTSGTNTAITESGRTGEKRKS